MTGNDLRHYLLADNGVAALIGTRFWASVLPQNGTLPAVVYFQVSGVNHGHLGGTIAAAQLRFQLDCYGATRGAADELAAAVIAALKTLWAAAPTSIGPSSNVPICDVRIGGIRHDTQPLAGGGDAHQYISSFDVELWNS